MILLSDFYGYYLPSNLFIRAVLGRMEGCESERELSLIFQHGKGVDASIKVT